METKTQVKAKIKILFLHNAYAGIPKRDGLFHSILCHRQHKV